MLRRNRVLEEKEISQVISDNLNKFFSEIAKNPNFADLNLLVYDSSKERNLNLSEKYTGELRDAEFISRNVYSLEPYSNLLSEEEFYKIVGLNKNNRLSLRSGLYQESLYGHYLEAKSLLDEGYLRDVFCKAIVFEQNLQIVRRLMKNRSFMLKWRREMGLYSPLSELKNTGSMKKINLFRNL